jgi:hypothetical protein
MAASWQVLQRVLVPHLARVATDAIGVASEFTLSDPKGPPPNDRCRDDNFSAQSLQRRPNSSEKWLKLIKANSGGQPSTGLTLADLTKIRLAQLRT